KSQLPTPEVANRIDRVLNHHLIASRFDLEDHNQRTHPCKSLSGSTDTSPINGRRRSEGYQALEATEATTRRTYGSWDGDFGGRTQLPAVRMQLAPCAQYCARCVRSELSSCMAY